MPPSRAPQPKEPLESAETMTAQERLTELAEICGRRQLTRDELSEAYALSVGADTLPELEEWLARQSEEESE